MDGKMSFLNLNLKAFKDKKTAIIVAVGLLGMVLILCSEMFQRNSSSAPAAHEDSENAYVDTLERRITKLLSGIDGVGKCDVMVTLDTGTQYVYATEEKSTVSTSADLSGSQRTDNQNNSEDNYIIVRGSDGSEQPVLLNKILPKVKGVAVICEGGDKAYVQQQVTEMVSTVLDVSSNNVCVIKKN
ncbi:MAG: hypothetical protein Q8865_05655 [Bacillota bacterium]|nr:hypothetical protein [Bacillota bacterium]